MYVAELETNYRDNLTCLSAQSESSYLWHIRLGHVSSFILNKLVSRDLVRVLPKLKFSDMYSVSCMYKKETNQIIIYVKQAG